MNLLNADQVKNYYGGNYATLEEFMRARTVFEGPYKPATQEVTVTAANHVLIDSTMLPGYVIAKDSTTTQAGTDNVVAASLAGAVGTGSIVTQVDSLGNILNKVQIRQALTNNPIESVDEKIVFGLIQSDNGAADGASVGATASENLQISFVKENDAGALELVTISDDIEFTIATIISNKNRPTLMRVNGEVGTDTKDIAKLSSLARVYVIATATAPAGTQINLATDALTNNGAATVVTTDPESESLGAAPLPTTGALFATEAKVVIERNGVSQAKSNVSGGGDVGFVSSTTIQLNVALAVGERIKVIVPQGY